MTRTLAVFAVIAVAFALLGRFKPRSADLKLTPRRPLTDREQSMYFRLVDALPGRIVLAQVSLGALLKAKSQSARNRFAQKVADFVVCSKAFEVLAVVELDDATHRGRAGRDRARDAMLQTAGIRTLRYANIPEAPAIVRDLAATPEKHIRPTSQ